MLVAICSPTQDRVFCIKNLDTKDFTKLKTYTDLKLVIITEENIIQYTKLKLKDLI